MKRFIGGLLGALFDVRVVIAIAGILLSIVMHELFHVILHWGEITSVHILANSQAIVEIAFIPTHDYNLLVEELCAYGIMALTLLLTCALIHDINDQRDTRSVAHIILSRDPSDTLSPSLIRQLRLTLGVDHVERN